MDKATTTKTRPTTAKLRVEIDLAKPLLKEVSVVIRNPMGNIDTFVQKIEYETLPPFCSFCNTIGHTLEKCGLKPQDATKEDNSREEDPLKPNNIPKNQGKMTTTVSGELKKGGDEAIGHSLMAETNRTTAENLGDNQNIDEKEGWLKVEKRKGRGNYSNKNQGVNGSNPNSNNSMSNSTTTEGQITQDNVGNGEMETTPYIDQQDTLEEITQPYKVMRWDRGHTTRQKKHQNKRGKNQQPILGIRQSKGGNGPSVENAEIQFQEEMINLVSVNQEAVNDLNKRRKKFQSKIIIPQNMTLEGEKEHKQAREAEQGDTRKWTELNFNKMINPSDPHKNNDKEKAKDYPRDNRIRKENAYFFHREPDPPDRCSLEEGATHMSDLTKEKKTEGNMPNVQTTTMDFMNEEMEEAKSDDDYTRRKHQEWENGEQRDHTQHLIIQTNNLSPRNQQHCGGGFINVASPDTTKTKQSNAKNTNDVSND